MFLKNPELIDCWKQTKAIEIERRVFSELKKALQSNCKEKKMQKSDLRTGMQVLKRSGQQQVVALKTSIGDVTICIFGTTYGIMDKLHEDMTHFNNPDFDVVKVFEVKNPKDGGLNKAVKEKLLSTDCIWTRDDSKIITICGKEFSENTIKAALESHCVW